MEQAGVAHYHLPGLFEFYELYRVFLPLFREHREYFYDWCDIGSIYGAPADCIWGGGRVGGGTCDPRDVRALMREYGISARLTFSNSLLRTEHLSDARCNALCALFSSDGQTRKRRDRPFGCAARVPAKDLSEALFRFVHHEGADGIRRPAGANWRGMRFRMLCRIFGSIRRLTRLGGLSADGEGQGGISLQRVLLVRLPGAEALL